MNFEETLNNIQEKLGEENTGIIADDIASLLSYESARNKSIEDKDNEISSLKKSKEMLIETNGKLLQKIAAGREEDLNPKAKESEEKKPINIRSAFDKNGNFIK